MNHHLLGVKAHGTNLSVVALHGDPDMNLLLGVHISVVPLADEVDLGLSSHVGLLSGLLFHLLSLSLPFPEPNKHLLSGLPVFLFPFSSLSLD